MSPKPPIQLSKILKKHIPTAFFASIVSGTRQKDRQKFLKAFGKKGIDATLNNFMCLTLGISENSANGVYMSRNMNERLLSHSINRSTRRHPDDKPYAELIHKPKGYTAFGVNVNVTFTCPPPIATLFTVIEYNAPK